MVLREIQPLKDVGGRPGYTVKRQGFAVWKYLLLILFVCPPLWSFVVPTVATIFLFTSFLGFSDSVVAGGGLLLGILTSAALSIWLVYGQWRLDKKRSSLGEARLAFNRRHYRAGDEISLEYERRMTRPRAEMGWAFLHLACVEVVATRQGTDTTYSEKVLWQHSFDPAPLFAEQTLQRAYWHIALPADLPPASVGKDHWVTWHLQLREDWEKELTYTHDFALDVGPSEVKVEPVPAVAPAEGRSWGRH